MYVPPSPSHGLAGLGQLPSASEELARVQQGIAELEAELASGELRKQEVYFRERELAELQEEAARLERRAAGGQDAGFEEYVYSGSVVDPETGLTTTTRHAFDISTGDAQAWMEAGGAGIPEGASYRGSFEAEYDQTEHDWFGDPLDRPEETQVAPPDTLRFGPAGGGPVDEDQWIDVPVAPFIPPTAGGGASPYGGDVIIETFGAGGPGYGAPGGSGAAPDFAKLLGIGALLFFGGTLLGGGRKRRR